MTAPPPRPSLVNLSRAICTLQSFDRFTPFALSSVLRFDPLHSRFDLALFTILHFSTLDPLAPFELLCCSSLLFFSIQHSKFRILAVPIHDTSKKILTKRTHLKDSLYKKRKRPRRIALDAKPFPPVNCLEMVQAKAGWHAARPVVPG